MARLLRQHRLESGARCGDRTQILLCSYAAGQYRPSESDEVPVATVLGIAVHIPLTRRQMACQCFVLFEFLSRRKQASKPLEKLRSPVRACYTAIVGYASWVR